MNIDTSTTKYQKFSDETEHNKDDKILLSNKSTDSNKNNQLNDRNEFTFNNSVKIMLFQDTLNILLLAAPVGLISWAVDAPDGLVFTFCIIALVPLAERLGFITEQVSLHTNDTIGALLNVTFGNFTELIVGITALNKGLYRLVQLSLLGSILSNLLLVLGCSFLAGGIYFKTLTFKTISSQVNSTLLILSTMGIIFPTALSISGEESFLSELGYSRATSFVLFFNYFAFLYFQLHSHASLYDDNDDNDSNITGTIIQTTKSNEDTNENINVNMKNLPLKGSKDSSNNSINANNDLNDIDSCDEDEDKLGLKYALIWLGLIAGLIAILSEAISSTIEDGASQIGLSGVFLAAIVLPIVGNATEHACAIIFAMKGRLDLSIGITVGSATQISCCVLPFLVILGWMMGKDLTLNMGGFEAATLLLTIICVTFAIKDGTSNWLIGNILISAYLLIMFGFWTHHDDDLSDKHA